MGLRRFVRSTAAVVAILALAGASIVTVDGSSAGASDETPTEIPITFSGDLEVLAARLASVPEPLAGPLPSAPLNLTATSGEDGQSTLSWQAPLDDGGSALEIYVAEVSTDGVSFSLFGWVNASETAAIASGLVNGTTYWFRMSAVNAVGIGPPSDAAETTPFGPPEAVRDIRLSGTGLLSWSGSDGGAPPMSSTIAGSIHQRVRGSLSLTPTRGFSSGQRPLSLRRGSFPRSSEAATSTSTTTPTNSACG